MKFFPAKRAGKQSSVGHRIKTFLTRRVQQNLLYCRRSCNKFLLFRPACQVRAGGADPEAAAVDS
jgi:hypothetical protein